MLLTTVLCFRAIWMPRPSFCFWPNLVQESLPSSASHIYNKYNPCWNINWVTIKVWQLTCLQKGSQINLPRFSLLLFSSPEKVCPEVLHLEGFRNCIFWTLSFLVAWYHNSMRIKIGNILEHKVQASDCQQVMADAFLGEAHCWSYSVMLLPLCSAHYEE